MSTNTKAARNKKCRLCRREKIKLFLKGQRCFSPKCPIVKKGGVPPGMHGLKSGIRTSEYGNQLREKQKLKRLYGLTENQLKGYFRKAEKLEGSRGDNFLKLLETRLDNVVYKLRWAPSRRMARQLICHGKITVNGKKVRTASYQVTVGDEAKLSLSATKLRPVEESISRKDVEIPSWLKVDKWAGKMVSRPAREQMPQEVKESLIIEFYSR